MTSMIHFRYRWLDKNYAGTSIKVVVKKLLLDQFLLMPPLLVIFYVGKFRAIVICGPLLVGYHDTRIGLTRERITHCHFHQCSF